jgi:ribosomal protein S18 acetylase RimI-like enzyme
MFINFLLYKIVMKYRLLSEREKQSSWKKINHFFTIIDNEFVPPLSSRGDTVKSAIKKNDKAEVIVAEANGKFVGIVIFWSYYYKVRSSYFHWLIVEPKFRSKGIGKELTKKAISRLHKKRIKTIKLVTYNTKKVALKIYESIGFKIYYTRKNIKGPGIDKVYLILK